MGIEKQIVLFFTICILFSGCGLKTENTPSSPPKNDFPEPTVLELAIQMTERWEGEIYTPPSTLPSSGSAIFNGYLVVNSVPLQGIGQLELFSDFSALEMSGSVQDFENQNGQSISGTLTVTNGMIDVTADPSSEFTFTLQLIGDLANSEGDYSIDANLKGDFLGTQFSAIIGVIEGELGTGATNYPLTGAFVGER